MELLFQERALSVIPPSFGNRDAFAFPIAQDFIFFSSLQRAFNYDPVKYLVDKSPAENSPTVKKRISQYAFQKIQ